MKKAVIFFACSACMLLFLTVFTCAFADLLPDDQIERWEFNKTKIIHNEAENANPPVFKLPASLTTIEDGAFEGTAITAVELPENVTAIGDYAFARIKTLRKISIPAATNFIGANAFKGSEQVVLTGAPKGYVRVWARNNGIPFDPIAGFYAYIPTAQITGLLIVETRLESLLSDEITESNPKAQPTGRFTGELKADQYERITAFHIQGRSPPMG